MPFDSVKACPWPQRIPHNRCLRPTTAVCCQWVPRQWPHQNSLCTRPAVGSILAKRQLAAGSVPLARFTCLFSTRRPSITPWHPLLAALVCIGAWAIIAVPSGQADVVLVRSTNSPAGRQRVEGTVEDYTGRELVLVDATGRRRRFKGQLVLQVEAEWTPEHVTGNEHLARGQYAQALRSFQKAAQRETRAWVRRLIAARLVEAHRELGQSAQACELFIELVQADPDTPWFEVAPLAWLPANPAPQLEERARKWLQDDDRPIALLLAASHLLQTASHEGAVARLETLAQSEDPRYRALARAQLWRAGLARVSPEQADRWSFEAEAFPTCALPGVAVVLARAHAAHKQYQAAALWGLRGALLHPAHALLAAEGLWQAGTALEKLGEPRAAARVLAELCHRFPNSRLARPASERLRNLDPELAAIPHTMVRSVAGASSPDAPAGRASTYPTAVELAPPEDGAAQFALLAGALRERRLHSILAWYADWLAVHLPANHPRLAELVCEHSRSLVDQALESPPDGRASLWQQAATAVHEFAKKHPDHPRLTLVELQAGLVELAQGELGREEALAAGATEAAEEVRARLRESIRLLQTAANHVQKLIRSQPRNQQAAFSTRELLALGQNIAFQLARAYRNQGLAYPPDSADRVNALQQAQELLGPLAQLETEHALAWPARLDEIQVLRLLGDLEQADARLALVMKAELPERLRQAAQAEALRLALAHGDLHQAISLAEATTAQRGPPAPDLLLALLEVWLAAWQQASEQKAAGDPLQAEGAPEQPADVATQRFRDQAAAMVQAMGQYGPYWSRRAEALLAHRARHLAATGDAELVRHAAAGLFRKGQIDQALEALAQARDAAMAAGDPAAAFEAAFMAAAMLESVTRNSEASALYRSAALTDTQNAKAAKAHLQAVYLVAHTSTGSQDAGATRALLEEHLRTWPEAPTAMQARVWLGRLHELAEAWYDAVAVYQQVPLDDRLGPEALAGAVRAYESLLAQSVQQGKDVSDVAATAGDHFASLVQGGKGTFPDEWSPAQREAAMAAARLWLLYSKQRYRQAERLLLAGLNGSPPPPAEWQAAAQGWLVFALAAQGERARAQEHLAQLSHSSSRELVELVLAVDPLLAAATQRVQRELALLQLALFEHLGARLSELADHEQAALAICHLRALLAAEDGQAALAEAQRIAEAWPDAGKVQEACALLLTDSLQPELVRLAAGRWQGIAARLSPGTDRWARANYYLALTWERLGQKKKAAALARYVQRLYPAAGSEELRAQYAALLKRCH